MKHADKYIDALQRLLNPFRRELEPVAGDRGLTFGGEVKGVDEVNRRVTAVLSTGSIDRYGEIVLPSAYEKSLPRFMENPKFLAGHAYGSFDGSPTSIGRWLDVRITDKELIGTAQFLPPGDALADKWWFRFLHGAQRTFSVGFIAHKYEMRDVSIGGENKRVRTFTEAELLEVSAVEIPANADAQLLAASLGLRGEASDGNRCGQDKHDIKAIIDQVDRLLDKHLNTDPGSKLACLIEDVVEACLRRRGHWEDDDGLDPAHVPGNGSKDQGLTEFTDELKAILG